MFRELTLLPSSGENAYYIGSDRRALENSNIERNVPSLEAFRVIVFVLYFRNKVAYVL
jgi:hypothetical protein